MQKTILSLLLISSIYSFGQDSTKSRFSVGINFSPNYCYRTLKYDDDDKTVVEEREEYEIAGYGYNTGLSLQYLFTNRLGAELGIEFSRQTSSHKDLTIGDGWGGSAGTWYREDRFNYLEIPINFHYRFIDKKFYVYGFLGGSVNIFVQNKSKLWAYFNDGSVDVRMSQYSASRPNRYIMALNGGLGLGYKANEKVDLNFKPIFRYSLKSVLDSNVEQYNYSVGCQLGFKINI